MPTNLKIDDKLILQAMKLGKHATKKEAVSACLEDYINRKKQIKITSLFGQVDYDKDYNYKTQRVKS
jgi:Arc/MetJ family transcription regulator